jgi:hypothetical protein
MRKILFCAMVLLFACGRQKPDANDKVFGRPSQTLRKGEYVDTELYVGFVLDSSLSKMTSLKSFKDLNEQLADVKEANNNDNVELPAGRMVKRDSASIVIRYDMFFNLPNVFDEEHGNILYIVIPSPQKVILNREYQLPANEFNVRAWRHGIWIGMAEYKNVCGTVVFNVLSREKVAAKLFITGDRNFMILQDPKESTMETDTVVAAALIFEKREK